MARFIEIVGVHRHEFMKKMEAVRPESVGRTPQKAELYHLRDLVSVLIGGDHEAEKFRKTKEEADRLALANSRSRGELVEITAVKRLGEKIMVAIRNRILAMPLTDEEKDRCLVELMGLASLDWSRSE